MLPMEPLSDPLNLSARDALAQRLVLVIDDDAALLALMQTYLKRYGATVLVASSGREAWTLMESLYASGTPVHAVLCDLRMQGGSGMELYQRVGAQLPAMASRMIFSSGDVESDDVRAFVASCNAPVLAKPYRLADLRRMLADMPSPN